jgi:catechol 2,3-dioxygenase-like lactoylglutathione lyase family enzyme
MTGDDHTARLFEVGTVFVPVSDQERSLTFYVETLGFELRVDFGYGGDSRWIEVAPPGAANTIALVPASEGASAGSDEARCALATRDIAAAHAALTASGVEVDAEIAGQGTQREGLISLDARIPDPAPAQFFFRDPDGNRFLIVQPG